MGIPSMWTPRSFLKIDHTQVTWEAPDNIMGRREDATGCSEASGYTFSPSGREEQEVRTLLF